MSPRLRLLVVSQHAAAFSKILQDADLPGLEVCSYTEPEAALPLCDSAQILFGAPDLLVPLLPHCSQLQWVQSSWAGVRPLVDASRRDYRLTGVRDIFGQTMAEYVLAWMLAFQRQVISRAQARHWDDRPDGSLAGKSIGIMGTGSIGCEVARFCSSFGLHTRGLNTSGQSVPHFEVCYAGGDIVRFAHNLDYLVALLPDTAATHSLIDSSVLDALKPGALLINAGRGNSINYADLLQALRTDQLGGAVLDVLPAEPLPTNDPLWQEPNLFITSHTAAPTSTPAIADIFCKNYLRLLAGEELLFEIAFNRGY